LAEELAASMLMGSAAPALLPSEPQSVLLDAESVEFPAALSSWLASVRGAGAAPTAAAAAAARLQAVADAVRRCEGPADACSDPARNPALARAVRAALEAGAPETQVADALALARSGAGVWAAELPTPSPPPLLVTTTVRGDTAAGAPRACEAAAAAWETGRLLVAFDPRDAEAAARLAHAPRAALNLEAFAGPEDLDLAGVEAAARLWLTGLDLQVEPHDPHRSVALGVAGLAEVLVARGLAYGEPAWIDDAAALTALVAGSAAAASAELAAALGPYP
jgi:ribonucleoside-diphosphate reductase alpha chain